MHVDPVDAVRSRQYLNHKTYVAKYNVTLLYTCFLDIIKQAFRK